MAKYRNQKPGILGLAVTKTDKEGNRVSSDLTVGPGEVFEAEKADIPQLYLDNGWIVDAKDDGKGGKAGARSETADQPLNPALEGPTPTQGSGTSPYQSTTDADAQKSGTYGGPRDHVDVKGTSGGTNPTDATRQADTHDDKKKK